MKQGKAVFLLILFSLIIFVCYLVPSGYFLTRENHFIWGGLLYFLIILFTSSKPLLVKSRVTYFWILYSPLLFYTMVGIYAFFNGSPDPLPVWLFSNFLFFLGFHLAPKTQPFRKIVLTIAVTSAMFTLGKIILMPNWLNFCATMRAKFETGRVFPELILVDKGGSIVNSSQWKGKTVVLDLWSSFCGPCIKKFPDYEKVFQHYKNDSSILVAALNLPANGEILSDRIKLPDNLKINFPHTFPHFFADTTAWKTLGINAVPEYLIIDSMGVVKYAGSLNIGQLEFYNNFFSLITKYANNKKN